MKWFLVKFFRPTIQQIVILNYVFVIFIFLFIKTVKKDIKIYLNIYSILLKFDWWNVIQLNHFYNKKKKKNVFKSLVTDIYQQRYIFFEIKSLRYIHKSFTKMVFNVKCFFFNILVYRVCTWLYLYKKLFLFFKL